jgi:hypothetical protein
MVTFQTPNPYWRKLINGMKNPFSTGKILSAPLSTCAIYNAPPIVSRNLWPLKLLSEVRKGLYFLITDFVFGLERFQLTPMPCHFFTPHIQSLAGGGKKQVECFPIIKTWGQID